MNSCFNEKIIDFFNYRADSWDSICFHDADKLSRITDLCRIQPNDRILDIACGTGVMIPNLLETSASQITGIDLSDKMIFNARQKYDDPRVEFSVDDIYGFSIEGWNCAIMYSAFPHLIFREQLVDRLCRILAPGGRFIVAHSESADDINRVHEGKPSEISIPLKAAEIEAKVFKSRFDIDTIIDNEEIYIFSGIMK